MMTSRRTTVFSCALALCAAAQQAAFAQDDHPNCSAATPSVASVWPPNHKMVDVSILGVTDPDGDPVAIRVDRITQDEPVLGTGSGNTAPDGAGLETAVAQVRAERAGSGNGRVYEISFTASDGAGGECTGRVKVCVPHDQGRSSCVDDGQIYDSAGAFDVRVYPTPFTPSTTIEFSLPEAMTASVVIYNVLGKQLRTLGGGGQSQGTHSVVWNGRDESGELVPSGVYLYRVQTGQLEQTGRLLLMK